MAVPLPLLSIGREGIAKDLADFLVRGRFGGARLVADTATWAALGARIQRELSGRGFSLVSTILEGEVRADEYALGLLLSEDAEEGYPLVAVGSGTITDIVRLYAARLRLPFVSLPTAASVDAYASSVSAMTLKGAKRTIGALPPEAIFVDLDTLRDAPPPMTAAGFGDMICKFSALADWRLGALLWGEPWDEAIADRSRAAAELCRSAADSIGRREEGGLRSLIGALIESGHAMSLAGHSRPASGAEHHLSHYWEMRLAREGRAPILHGLKVGVATVIAAGLWEMVGRLSRREAEARLGASGLPEPTIVRDVISREFGDSAPAVLASQGRFLALEGEELALLKRDILEHWDDILSLARSVPGKEETRALLERAGCPTEPSRIGLGTEYVRGAMSAGHFLRDRFTVRRLASLLGLDSEIV